MTDAWASPKGRDVDPAAEAARRALTQGREVSSKEVAIAEEFVKEFDDRDVEAGGRSQPKPRRDKSTPSLQRNATSISSVMSNVVGGGPKKIQRRFTRKMKLQAMTRKRLVNYDTKVDLPRLLARALAERSSEHGNHVEEYMTPHQIVQFWEGRLGKS
eukprot:scaffold2658_cov246-Pinguiococcus_pyrenoidosus.AAC.3